MAHSGENQFVRDGMVSEGVREHFSPVVDYFSQRFWFQRDFNAFELRDIRSDLPRHIDRVVSASNTWNAPVRVVDLHSSGGANQAREILRDVWHEGLTVVSYGKGKQVLHSVFLEVLGDQHQQKLLGRGGETPSRPMSSTGVVIHEDVEALWSRSIDSLYGTNSRSLDANHDPDTTRRDKTWMGWLRHLLGLPAA